MKSILYLNNRYCTSVNDVTYVLSKIDNNLESPLFHELRRAFQDGILSAWLSEGSQYEKELASKLDQMPPSVTNEIMLRQFNLLFADKDVDIQKPSYKEYFSLQSSRYKFSKNIDSAYSNVSSNIYMSVREGEIILELNFEIHKTANLDYTISVELQNDKREILCKDTCVLSLKTIGKTYMCLSTFDISRISNEGLICVYIDDVKIKSFGLLNRPEPSFTQDCTGPQKKVIKELLRQMEFIPETTGYFRIFDGNRHKATLTPYYVSPLITAKQYYMIMHNTEGPNYVLPQWPMCQIEEFVKRLNQLSSLQFNLPSEAQWLNAVKIDKIKLSQECPQYEWMLDRRGQRTQIESNINPVCITKSPYSVYRRDIDERDFCDYSSFGFRLVLMIS